MRQARAQLPLCLGDKEIDWKVHTYATLPSTQQYVLELVEEGLPEGTVVQALTQTRGRGRHGRDWESPLGNLYMSFLLRPGCKAGEAVQLSFVAALAVSKAMRRFVTKSHNIGLKWPNDVLIDSKKCSGILLESVSGPIGRVSGLAVGIGVNILSAPDGATCLSAVSADQVPIHPFRDDVLAEFNLSYKQWQERGFQPIREAWLNQAYGIGKEVSLTTGSKQQKGILEGIDETGALLLREGEQVNKYSSGSLLIEGSE